jgi:hypothetical protein
MDVITCPSDSHFLMSQLDIHLYDNFLNKVVSSYNQIVKYIYNSPLTTSRYKF